MQMMTATLFLLMMVVDEYRTQGCFRALHYHLFPAPKPSQYCTLDLSYPDQEMVTNVSVSKIAGHLVTEMVCQTTYGVLL